MLKFSLDVFFTFSVEEFGNNPPMLSAVLIPSDLIEDSSWSYFSILFSIGDTADWFAGKTDIFILPNAPINAVGVKETMFTVFVVGL